jgi:NAD(P)-dependent dehydrogenase (short-subunit alcohol dehydrogenase family)
MGKLASKKALITGSSSGIGAGSADVVVNFPNAAQAANAQIVSEQVTEAGANAFPAPFPTSYVPFMGQRCV